VELHKAILILFVAVGAVNVSANINEEKNLKIIYATKPLLMPLLIATYLTAGCEVNGLVVAALAFGMAGDVFLMIPLQKERMFMAGLGAFLVNQLLYVAAFLLSVDWRAGFEPGLLLFAVPYLVYGIVMYRVLEKHLGKMKGAVIVYMAAILMMGLSSLLRRISHEGPAFWLVLIGALVFIASDSILAYDKFVSRVRLGKPLIMLTYLAAQLLITRGFVLS
jgi:uncharacterized membrane protein YhhN